MPYVRVAFPVPVRQTFIYETPPELAARAVPGAEVRCPFGRLERRGFVVARSDEADRAEVKALAGVVGDGPVFPPAVLKLCHWIADYYLAPIGRVLAGALPGGLEGFAGSRARKSAYAGGAGDVVDPDPSGPRAGALPAGPAPGATAGPAPGALVLTQAQRLAADAMCASVATPGYRAFLLHGVTGSGKTEVYLEAARAARRAGRRTLVLVPEVALSHQLVEALRRDFGGRVGVLHSYLSVGERRANWERARRGALDVVVGARSAVFAPLADVGLVVVDEEHDPAYKQSEQTRYHGRDTALVRARFEGATAVLGTATPSLESYANVQRGKMALLSLPERVDGRPLPVVEIVDLGEIRGARAPAAAGTRRPAGRTLFTPPLLEALAAALARGEQALVFLNRRGHTRALECEDCGYVGCCPDCDVALTWHSTGDAWRCHYCGHVEAAPVACPKCESPFFRHRGSGTQRAEREMREHFPAARVLRLDSDSARPRGEQARILRAFGRGEADVLLGTQMIGKGLDYHALTVVGVLSADGSLHLPDFRAAERTFQTLVQVAGRAGRGTRPGRVIVQTRVPDHYSLTAAAAHDFQAFADREMAYRKDMNYPPFARLVSLGLSGKDESRVIAAAEALAARVRQAPQARPGLEILGPAPAPLARLRGKYRWRITLRDSDTARLHAVTRSVLEGLDGADGRDGGAARAAREARLPAGVAVAVDVDPYDVL